MRDIIFRNPDPEKELRTHFITKKYHLLICNKYWHQNQIIEVLQYPKRKKKEKEKDSHKFLDSFHYLTLFFDKIKKKKKFKIVLKSKKQTFFGVFQPLNLFVNFLPHSKKVITKLSFSNATH